MCWCNLAKEHVQLQLLVLLHVFTLFPKRFDISGQKDETAPIFHERVKRNISPLIIPILPLLLTLVTLLTLHPPLENVASHTPALEW